MPETRKTVTLVLTADSNDFSVKVMQAGEAMEKMAEKAKESSSLMSSFMEGVGIGTGMEALELGLKIIEAGFELVAKAAEKAWEMTKQGIEAGAQALHASQALGISVAAFTQLDYVAKAVGVSTQTLTSSIGRMEANLGTAATQGGHTAKMLASLGINARELASMKDPGEMFMKVAASLNNIGNATERAEAGRALFGRGWMDIMPVLSMGGDKLQELVKHAQETGYALSDSAAKAAEEAQVSMNELSLALDGVKRILAAQLGPYIKMAADWMRGLFADATKTGAFIKKAIDIIKDALIVLAEVVQFITEVDLKAIEIMYEMGYASMKAANMIAQAAYYASFKKSDAAKSALVVTQARMDEFKNEVEGTKKALDQIGSTDWGDRLSRTFKQAEAAAKKANEAIASKPGELPDADAQKKADEFEKRAAQTQKGINDIIGSLIKADETFGEGKGEIAAYNLELQGATQWEIAYAQILGLDIDKKKAAAEATKKQAEEYFKLYDAVNKLVEGGPLTEYHKKQEELNKMFELGLIDIEQYYAGLGNAYDELEKQTKKKKEHEEKEKIQAPGAQEVSYAFAAPQVGMGKGIDQVANNTRKQNEKQDQTNEFLKQAVTWMGKFQLPSLMGV